MIWQGLKFWYDYYGLRFGKKGKRKVQGVPQSQTVAHPRHQEEEETDKTKQARAKLRPKTASHAFYASCATKTVR